MTTGRINQVALSAHRRSMQAYAQTGASAVTVDSTCQSARTLPAVISVTARSFTTQSVRNAICLAIAQRIAHHKLSR